MTMRFTRTFLAVMLAALVAVPAARAETFAVSGTGDAAGNCTSTECASIRQALASAAQNPGADIVTVPAGTYQLTLGALQVDSTVTIQGAGARATSVVGGASARVFEVGIGATNATLSGLTIRGGTATDAAGDGGNIRNQGGKVGLSHVRITGGSASSGGGVANRNGSMLIQQSLIDRNSAKQGGGEGGAIVNFGGDGGIGADLVVRDSTVAFNEANVAGGIVSRGNVQNATTLQGVTLARNVGGLAGTGGIQVSASDGGTFRAGGSIIAGNVGSGLASNCSGTPPTSDGGNLESAADCGLTGPSDHQNANPQLSTELQDAGGQTDVLTFPRTSPAVDLVEQCSSSDQTDRPRPQGPACDSGAFEFDQQPPEVRILTGPDGPTRDTTHQFTFQSPEPGVTFECRLHRPGDTVPPEWAHGCTSPFDVRGLQDGLHELQVRGTDAAGNVSVPQSRSFTVDTVAPAPSAARGDLAPPQQPQQQPARAPAPSSRPAPVPEFQQTVVIRPISGRILVRRPGSTAFAELDGPRGIPLGSTVDSKRGRVQLAAEPGQGKATQRALLYGGIFKVTQPAATVDLTLAEALAPCKPGKAAAATGKPTSRKLWGDGKGNFRTRGRYSVAIVRGVKWLVSDSCSGTLTRVAQGVVSVRDNVRRTTVLVRAGRSYVARPRR